ncbi:MORN repeat-containing protein 1 [Balamuthia mandrillaris]
MEQLWRWCRRGCSLCCSFVALLVLLSLFWGLVAYPLLQLCFEQRYECHFYALEGKARAVSRLEPDELYYGECNARTCFWGKERWCGHPYATYHGRFLNGKMHGQGQHNHSTDGPNYTGLFEDDQYHGEGGVFYVEHWSVGLLFHGNFHRGRLHGECSVTIVAPDSNQEQSLFDDLRAVTIRGSKMKGTCVYGVMEGPVQIHLQKADAEVIFEGELTDTAIDGRGRLGVLSVFEDAKGDEVEAGRMTNEEESFPHQPTWKWYELSGSSKGTDQRVLSYAAFIRPEKKVGERNIEQEEEEDYSTSYYISCHGAFCFFENDTAIVEVAAKSYGWGQQGRGEKEKEGAGRGSHERSNRRASSPLADTTQTNNRIVGEHQQTKERAPVKLRSVQHDWLGIASNKEAYQLQMDLSDVLFFLREVRDLLHRANWSTFTEPWPPALSAFAPHPSPGRSRNTTATAAASSVPSKEEL